MLTARLLKNAHQAAVYFEQDDYYVDGEQIAPSAWWGEGGRRLGLTGEIDRGTFADLLEGRLPNGVEVEKGGPGSHRAGTDLTFSAPKSVSLAALVGGDQRILEAHERAVTVALEYLEETAGRARRRTNGILQFEETDNLLVARFNHDSSRAADPQLHTHCVVLNITRRKDGEWKTLANEELFRSQKIGGAIYRAELARSLRALGYSITRTHADGRFELAGLSNEMLDAFSRRRLQILEHLNARGLGGPKAADVAARATRDRKQDIDRHLLRAEWRNRAGALGIDLEHLHGRPIRIPRGTGRQSAEAALDHAVHHATERRVVAPERHLLQLALGLAVGDLRLDDIRRALDRRVERGELVPAISARQKDPFARHFTTDRALATEQNLLHILAGGANRVSPIAQPEDLDRILDTISKQSAFALTEGQQNAIKLVLSTSDRLVGIQGYAGTGKTSGALLHIRRVAESAGIEVWGFAPSAAAAQVLSDEAGIPSMTVARLLRSKPNPQKHPQLWVVDESSMLGNEAARDLLLAARTANARVVLVGDRDQLPAVEAGRPFALLMDHSMKVAAIDTIVRQKDRDLKHAVEKTIDRNHGAALDLIAPRIEVIPKREDRLRAVARAYADAPPAERKRTLVVTPSNVDRERLNAIIRSALRARGDLGQAELGSQILVARGLTDAQTRDIAEYRIGDVVRFDRRYKRIRVQANDYFTVRAVDGVSGTIHLEDAEGRSVRWKPKVASKVEVYETDHRQLSAGDLIRWTRNDQFLGLNNGDVGEVVTLDPSRRTADLLVRGELHTIDLAAQQHWEHAYASTVHAVQGRTADRILLHLDTSQPHLLGHESWYVGLSRARLDVRVFTDDASRLPIQIQRSLQQESALEVARPELPREQQLEKHRAEPKRKPVERAHWGFEFGR